MLKKPNTFGLQGYQCGITCHFTEKGQAFHVVLFRAGTTSGIRRCQIFLNDELVHESSDADITMSAPIARAKLTAFLEKKK